MTRKTKQLIDYLSQDAEPVGVISHPLLRLLLWGVACAAYLGTFVLVIGLREDLNIKLNELLFQIELVLAAITCISAAIAALLLSVPDGYQFKKMRWIPVIGFSILSSLLYLQWQHPLLLRGVHVAHSDNTYQCMLDISAFALMPVLLLFFMLITGAPTERRWAGAMAGLAAASLSHITLRLLEPNDDIAHILVWHYLPVVFIVLLTILIARRYLRW